MSTPVKSAVGTPTGAGEETPPKPATPLVSRYRTFCYRLFGERLDTGEGQEAITEQLQRAGMSVTPGMHYSVEIVTSAIAAATGFVISLLLFDLVLHSPLWYLFVLVITVVAAGRRSAASVSS